MQQDLTSLSDVDLRSLSKTALLVLGTVAWGFKNQHEAPDIIRSLTEPEGIVETINKVAAKDPELIELVLRVSVAALVNVQSVEAVDAEIKRRAVTGN